MQGNPLVLRPIISTQHNPASQTNPQTNVAQPNTSSISLMLVLPVVFIVALVGYRKHRATVLQQQVKSLNRLWQLDSSKKPS